MESESVSHERQRESNIPLLLLIKEKLDSLSTSLNEIKKSID
jgi:hypothetical protein